MNLFFFDAIRALASWYRPSNTFHNNVSWIIFRRSSYIIFSFDQCFHEHTLDRHKGMANNEKSLSLCEELAMEKKEYLFQIDFIQKCSEHIHKSSESTVIVNLFHSVVEVFMQLFESAPFTPPPTRW